MAGQTKFFNFLTVCNNFRGLFLNRSPVTNFTQVATLRAASKEKLKNLPEKPKKPLPPFFLYSQTRREELRKVHPHAKVTEITKLLADEWNKIDGSAKQEYEVEYKQAMTQYLKKSLDYNTKLTEDEKKILQEVAAEKARDKKNRAVRKALKELNKPKRPKDDKKRYELEMEEWETKMINDGKLDLVRTNTRIISTTPRRIIKPKLNLHLKLVPTRSIRFQILNRESSVLILFSPPYNVRKLVT
ncbi:hypothetical protein Trydic_g3272 [Trypoxylus dichotomus]